MLKKEILIFIFLALFTYIKGLIMHFSNTTVNDFNIP